MSSTPPFFRQPREEGETDPGAIMKTRLRKVLDFAADAERRHSPHVGLSEYGHPCARKLAYKLTGHAAVNTGGDNWASTAGTWNHAGITETIRRMDPGGDEWLLDRKVLLGGAIPGTLDAHHLPTGFTLDFKFSGPDTIADYRKTAPPQYYVTQIHGYGAALAEEGYDVSTVGIAFIPRAFDLTNMWVWSAPFDPEIPRKALTRYIAIHDLLDGLGMWDGATGQDWAEVPASPSRACIFCDYFKPGETDLAVGCPGNREVS